MEVMPRFIPFTMLLKRWVNLFVDLFCFFMRLPGVTLRHPFSILEKNTAWDVYIKNKAKFVDLFVRLSIVDNLCTNDFLKIQHFVCLLYSKDTNVKTVNECRLLFHKKGVGFQRLPPTESALFHHSLQESNDPSKHLG